MAVVPAQPRPRVTLRGAIEKYGRELTQDLSSNTLFLTYLAKHGLIKSSDILRYERHKERTARNTELLTALSQREELPDDYNRFLDALRQTDQHSVAAMMTNVTKELDMVDKYQNALADTLQDLRMYIKTEGRRAEVRFATASPGKTPTQRAEENMQHTLGSSLIPPSFDRDALVDFLYKVHTTTKTTLAQFERCKEVIEKLHKDCDDVARANADMLARLRECDNKIKEIIPEPAQTGNISRSETSSSVTPRSKRNEAELLYASIQENLKSIQNQLNTKNVESGSCLQIIDNMIKDIESRQAILEKATDPPPRDGRENKYFANVHPSSVGNKRNAPPDPLRDKLADLAKHLVVYVHQESQVTHKAAISHYQSGLLHRNFDAVDDDLKHLQREIRRGDHERAMELMNHLVDVTKTERKDCLALVDTIEKTLRDRRNKLSEPSTSRPRRRPRVARSRKKNAIESNFSRRLGDLANEVQVYIGLETERVQKTKADMAQKKKEFDQELKGKTQQLKELEKKKREVEVERDKYKRLYGTEKANFINKPTIPKRGSERKTRPEGKPYETTRSRKSHLPDIKQSTERDRHLRKLKEDIKVKTRQQARVKPLPRIQEVTPALEPVKPNHMIDRASGARRQPIKYTSGSNRHTKGIY